MVGTAVQRLSDCNDVPVTANGTIVSSDDDDVTNATITVCVHEPVDIAVTLAMMVGVLMVRDMSIMFNCAILH